MTFRSNNLPYGVFISTARLNRAAGVGRSVDMVSIMAAIKPKKRPDSLLHFDPAL